MARSRRKTANRRVCQVGAEHTRTVANADAAEPAPIMNQNTRSRKATDSRSTDDEQPGTTTDDYLALGEFVNTHHERPGDCRCWGREDMVALAAPTRPCGPCERAGFTEPAPQPDGEDTDAEADGFALGWLHFRELDGTERSVPSHRVANVRLSVSEDYLEDVR